MWFAALGIVLVIFVGYAFALLYHWLRYGFLYPAVFIVLPIWGAGSFVLFSLMMAAFASL